MKQMTFADAKHAGKRKQTRKELFLIEMDRVVPWKGLIALVEPYYPKGEGGRPAYPLMAMLRALPDAELVRLSRSGDGGGLHTSLNRATTCEANVLIFALSRHAPIY